MMTFVHYLSVFYWNRKEMGLWSTHRVMLITSAKGKVLEK